RCGGLDDDYVEIFNVLEIAEQSERDESILVVGPHVHRVLNLVAHDSNDREVEAANVYALAHRGSTLKNTARCLISQDDHPIVLSEILLGKVASIFQGQLAHLPVRELDA